MGGSGDGMASAIPFCCMVRGGAGGKVVDRRLTSLVDAEAVGRDAKGKSRDCSCRSGQLSLQVIRSISSSAIKLDNLIIHNNIFEFTQLPKLSKFHF